MDINGEKCMKKCLIAWKRCQIKSKDLRIRINNIEGKDMAKK